MIGDPVKLEEMVKERFAALRVGAEAEGTFVKLVADDDQTIQHLRNHGWSELAIGAYLVVESTWHVIGCDPALEMCSALFASNGSVR